MKRFLLALLLASHGLMARPSELSPSLPDLSPGCSGIRAREEPQCPSRLLLKLFTECSGNEPRGPDFGHAARLQLDGHGWSDNRTVCVCDPRTEGNQTVYLQIKGWSASYGTNWAQAKFDFLSFGETDIRQVTLAPEAGPGTIIWQSTSGTNPNKFYPLTFGVPLTPPAS